MKKILAGLLILILCTAFAGCGGKSGTDSESEPESQTETVSYGSVEKETVETTIAKFNTQVKDSSSLNPAMNEYSTINNNQYWYGLITGVYCVAIPEKYTGDKKADITAQTFLYVENETEHKTDAMTYFKLLIKANNPNLTDAEAEQLITEAEALAPSKKYVHNGKGIQVGISVGEDHSEYQVIRIHG